MNKVLLFSEYRIEQALYLQKLSNEPLYKDDSYAKLCLTQYDGYLSICGVNNEEIEKFLYDTWTFKTNPEMKTYDYQISNNNLNKYVDQNIKRMLNKNPLP